LKKSTLEIVCMDGAPHKIGIKFLADVDKACRASAAFRAKEDATGGNAFSAASANASARAISVPFTILDPGLGQAFAQSVETYVDTKAFAAHELITATTDGTRVYPLVIRLECVGDEDDGEGGNSLLRRTHTLNDLPAHPVGGLAANQRWSQSQTTYVELTATPAPSGRGAVTYAAHVLKQKIWVHGASYELQEIYGIDACTPGATNSGDDDGKECVICLSEPRTTTVLPCRHLCMCADCAHTLRSQPSGNVCPICRNPCESLLEIKVASSSGV